MEAGSICLTDAIEADHSPTTTFVAATRKVRVDDLATPVPQSSPAGAFSAVVSKPQSSPSEAFSPVEYDPIRLPVHDLAAFSDMSLSEKSSSLSVTERAAATTCTSSTSSVCDKDQARSSVAEATTFLDDETDITTDATCSMTCLDRSSSEPSHRLRSCISSSQNSSSRSCSSVILHRPASCCSRGRERRISFDKIQIRRYPVILGDNPEVSIGPPIALGWDYDEIRAIDLDSYERRKQNQAREVRVLSAFTRRQILLRGQCTSKEITQRIKEVKRDRHKRALTLKLLPFAKIESAAESAKRKVDRAVHGNPERHNTSTSSRADDSQVAAATRRRRSFSFTSPDGSNGRRALLLGAHNAHNSAHF